MAIDDRQHAGGADGTRRELRAVGEGRTVDRDNLAADNRRNSGGTG